jgi:hypothetical protein
VLVGKLPERASPKENRNGRALRDRFRRSGLDEKRRQYGRSPQNALVALATRARRW